MKEMVECFSSGYCGEKTKEMLNECEAPCTGVAKEDAITMDEKQRREEVCDLECQKERYVCRPNAYANWYWSQLSSYERILFTNLGYKQVSYNNGSKKPSFIGNKSWEQLSEKEKEAA